MSMTVCRVPGEGGLALPCGPAPKERAETEQKLEVPRHQLSTLGPLHRAQWHFPEALGGGHL